MRHVQILHRISLTQNFQENLSKFHTEYEYNPLKSGEIRLLRIRRSKSRDGYVRCSIFHTELSKASDYVAVSYTWGDPSDKIGIICGHGGESMQVTHNCATILQRLRALNLDITVWIDAICINQSDIAERNSQVRLMSKIYAGAFQVLVDLGGESEDSNIAIDTIEAPAGYSQKPNSTQITAVAALLNRPWFKRAWVLQEVYFSKGTEVFCGMRRFEWLDVVSWFITNQHLEGVEGVPCPVLVSMDRYQGPYKAASNLLHLLYRTQGCQSTDPRDKVFALLGMLSDSLDVGLVADYNKTTRTVYLELAIALLHMHGIALLTCAQTGSSIEDLPSWVPDWSLPPENMAEREGIAGPDATPWRQFRTGRTQKFADFEVLHKDTSRPTLKVNGFLIDTVSSVVELLDTSTCPWKDIQETYVRLYSKVLQLPAFTWASTTDTNDVVLFRTFTHTHSLPFNAIIDDFRVLLGKQPVRESYKEADAEKLKKKVRVNIHNQAVCLTTHNVLGLLPRQTQVSDTICVLPGCPMPLVMRHSGSHWTLIGPCYVDALMHNWGSVESWIVRLAATVNDENSEPKDLRLREFLIE